MTQQPTGGVEQLNLLGDAAVGTRGKDQERIALVGLQWLTTLLCKNADYGSSAWKPPILRPGLNASDAILVRMSDKIERIATLGYNAPEVVDESFEDTISDLGSYCLLWLARPKPGLDTDSDLG